jgi:hypothetical protein
MITIAGRDCRHGESRSRHFFNSLLIISREDSHRGVSSSMRTEAPNFASRRALAMASLSELKRRRASRPSVGLKATIQPPFSRKFHFADTRKVLTMDTVLPLPFASRTFREERSGFSLATAGLVAIPAGSAIRRLGAANSSITAASLGLRNGWKVLPSVRRDTCNFLHGYEP